MKKNPTNLENSEKSNKYSKKSQSLDILSIITKFTSLYINSKKARNLSKKTISNAELIIERFYE